MVWEIPEAFKESVSLASAAVSVCGAVLLEAIPAVNGPSLSGFEGYLAFCATVRAGRVVHFPGLVSVSIVPVSVFSVGHIIYLLIFFLALILLPNFSLSTYRELYQYASFHIVLMHLNLCT